MICPFCKTTIDGTGTCYYDCDSEWCGRCDTFVDDYRGRHECDKPKHLTFRIYVMEGIYR